MKLESIKDILLGFFGASTLFSLLFLESFKERLKRNHISWAEKRDLAKQILTLISQFENSPQSIELDKKEINDLYAQTYFVKGQTKTVAEIRFFLVGLELLDLFLTHYKSPHQTKGYKAMIEEIKETLNPLKKELKKWL